MQTKHDGRRRAELKRPMEGNRKHHEKTKGERWRVDIERETNERIKAREISGRERRAQGKRNARKGSGKREAA